MSSTGASNRTCFTQLREEEREREGVSLVNEGRVDLTAISRAHAGNLANIQTNQSERRSSKASCYV